MQTGETVVLVARDGELRRSYEFALQAEGFHVEPHSSLTAAYDAKRAAGTICVLVDDTALNQVQRDQEILDRLGLPIILLVSGFGHLLGGGAASEVLIKPLQGTQLVDCIDRLRGTERLPDK